MSHFLSFPPPYSSSILHAKLLTGHHTIGKPDQGSFAARPLRLRKKCTEGTGSNLKPRCVKYVIFNSGLSHSARDILMFKTIQNIYPIPSLIAKRALYFRVWSLHPESEHYMSLRGCLLLTGNCPGPYYLHQILRKWHRQPAADPFLRKRRVSFVKKRCWCRWQSWVGVLSHQTHHV